jgi:acetyl esterase/lipase
VGELSLPDGAPRGLAVLIHGGFWRDSYDLSLMRPLAADLAARGWAAWNVEYRRLGSGGGWPQTFDDVAAQIQTARRGAAPAAAGRVVAVGHSAGGHLALLAAARGLVTHVVAQAAVWDLPEAARLDLSDGAALELVGGRPELLEEATPRPPLPVPALLVHGAADDIVPVSMSRAFHAAAGDTELVEYPGGHFEHLDPESEAWRAVVAWLE